MKLKGLKLNNFAKFSDIEVVFNDQVTHLVGLNGAGKSTLGLTGLQAGLKGIAEKNKDGQLIGERFRFIGPAKKSADIVVTIIDEKKDNAEIIVRNKITKEGNNISFEAPEGYVLSPDWLSSLLNSAFLSAKNFTQLNAKEQALALGIDTDTVDDEIKEQKLEITNLNRDLKNLGVKEEVEKKEPVSVSELSKLLKEINEENEKVKEFNRKHTEICEKLDAKKERLLELHKELDQLEIDIAAGNKWVAKNKVKPLMPTESIDKQIEDAEKINKEAQNWVAYEDWANKTAVIENKLTTAKDKLDKLTAKRLELITSFDFGIEGLEVDSSGGLLLNDRPIRDPYFSKGELEVIVAKLYASTNPTLKLRFIDDYDLLDDNNADVLVKELLEKGFQIITAKVGTTLGANTLLLKEGKIIKEGDVI